MPGELRDSYYDSGPFRQSSVFTSNNDPLFSEAVDIFAELGLDSRDFGCRNRFKPIAPATMVTPRSEEVFRPVYAAYQQSLAAAMLSKQATTVTAAVATAASPQGSQPQSPIGRQDGSTHVAADPLMKVLMPRQSTKQRIRENLQEKMKRKAAIMSGQKPKVKPFPEAAVSPINSPVRRPRPNNFYGYTQGLRMYQGYPQVGMNYNMPMEYPPIQVAPMVHGHFAVPAAQHLSQRSPHGTSWIDDFFSESSMRQGSQRQQRPNFPRQYYGQDYTHEMNNTSSPSDTSMSSGHHFASTPTSTPSLDLFYLEQAHTAASIAQKSINLSEGLDAQIGSAGRPVQTSSKNVFI